MPSPAPPPSVYISYAHDDQAWRDRIASLLNDAGISVWHPAPGEPGEDYELAAQAIRESARVFVLLFSTRYIDSDEIHRIEFPHIRSLARARKARLICVILEPCPWQSFFAMPDVLADLVPEGDRTLSKGDEEQIKDDLHTLLQKVSRAVQEPAVVNLGLRGVEMQTQLSDLGFSPGPIDGYFGPLTESALKSFQQTQGLPVTGGIDDTTLNKLRELAAARQQQQANAEAPAETAAKAAATPAATQAIRLSRAARFFGQPDIDRLSKEARAVLSRANQIRRQYKRRRIHIEHLLLTFANEPASQFAALLSAHLVNLAPLLEPGLGGPVVEPPTEPAPELKSFPAISANVRRALSHALDKANREHSQAVEPFHILFGVLSTIENERVKALSDQGVTPDKVHPPSPVPPAAPTPKIVSDRWSDEDTLGYGAYARTLAGVIAHEETVPPLTIGIKAPWGAGKTSLMKQLQYILDGEAGVTEENKAATINKDTSQISLTISDLWKKLNAEIKVGFPGPKSSKLGELYNIRPRITVWFNAWKYQTSEQVWAGLAHCIISQVTARMDTRQRESFWLKLHSRRVNKEAVRREIYGLLLRYLAPIVVIGILFSLAAAWIISPFSQAIIPILGIKLWWAKTVLPFFTLVSLLWKGRDKLGEKAADAFKDLVREPDYEGKMGFLHLVESDIRDVLNLVATKQTPIVIFVDDLDRCVPRKVAEVVEAINLSLCGDYPNCIFVLGMEPGMVAAALEVANKEVIEKARELSLLDTSVPLGWRFMEKIVQLPVNIPSPTEAGLRGYAASLTGGVSSTENKESKGAEAPTESLPAKEKISEWKARFETPGTVSDVVNLTERFMAAAPPEERLAVAEASKQMYAEKFVDRDPLVSKFIEEIFSLVGGNPRQIKRYINVFRFHSTLRHNLKVDSAARGVPVTVPSDKGLAKLIALTIQWPHAAEFLRKTRTVRMDGGAKMEPVSLLRLLEQESRTIGGQHKKADATWIQFLKGVALGQAEWMATRSFREFLAEGESLSEIEGCGLW